MKTETQFLSKCANPACINRAANVLDVGDKVLMTRMTTGSSKNNGLFGWYCSGEIIIDGKIMKNCYETCYPNPAQNKQV
jgi:hypothetical protein